MRVVVQNARALFTLQAERKGLDGTYCARNTLYMTNTKTATATALELTILSAIRDSEYQDSFDGTTFETLTSVWSKDLTGKDKSLVGALGSAVKKGLAASNGESCWLTAEGFAALT